jgi:hypothetical protein
MNLKIGNWIGFGKIGLENYRSSKWTNPVNKIGIRPILRRFTNRYYIVYAERIKWTTIFIPAHNEELSFH